MLVFIEIVVLMLVVAVAAVLFVASRRSDRFRLTRSIWIESSPEAIFRLINSFTEWSKWSPWENLDPSMQKTFSGPAEGPGSIYQWKGNGKVGEGRMEMTSTVPGREVHIRLSLLKPMRAENDTVFLLGPEQGGTRLTWTMAGDMKLINKVFDLLMSMDRLVGKDFDKGLAGLKAEAERS